MNNFNPKFTITNRQTSAITRIDQVRGFLDWLAQTIEGEKVDALLVAGDVFDTSTLSNWDRYQNWGGVE